MPTLNILKLNLGDSQEDIRNKVNANFESLIQNVGGKGLEKELEKYWKRVGILGEQGGRMLIFQGFTGEKRELECGAMGREWVY